MKNLAVHRYRVDDVTILDITGRLEAPGESLDIFRRALQDAARQGNRLFVFDLSGLTHIDSMGLSALIRSHSEIETLGGAIKLAGLTGHARDLMVLTRLVTTFDFYETEHEAVDSFHTEKEPQATIAQIA